MHSLGGEARDEAGQSVNVSSQGCSLLILVQDVMKLKMKPGFVGTITAAKGEGRYRMLLSFVVVRAGPRSVFAESFIEMGLNTSECMQAWSSGT